MAGGAPGRDGGGGDGHVGAVHRLDGGASAGGRAQDRLRQVSHCQHANQAVDQVRRQEHRARQAQGKDWLAGTKDDWLRHPDRFTLAAWRVFVGFARRTKLKTGRAWALKEMLMTLWDYRDPGAAERHFPAWYQWVRSRLEPMKRVARMLKRHWSNIRTFFAQRITNAGAESMNPKIQKLKVLARGFRNRERFRHAIFFHLGGRDLYPGPLTARS
jgi:transposase